MESTSRIPEQNFEPGRIHSGAYSVVPPWDMYTVAVALFTGYILMPLLISNILTLINPFIELGARLFVEQGATLLTWASIFAVLNWKYGHLRAYLGLSLTRPVGYYAWETVKLVLLTVGLNLLMNVIWSAAGVKGGENPYRDYGAADLAVLFSFAILMAPVLEELIFRGLVQSTFHKISPPLRSVIFTSLVFLLLHTNYFDNVKALTQVLVLGLCFGIWRERTQSLIPGMAAHLMNNVLASFVLFYMHQHPKPH